MLTTRRRTATTTRLGLLVAGTALLLAVSAPANAAGASAQVTASAICASQYSDGTFEKIAFTASISGLGPMLHYSTDLRRSGGATVQSIQGSSSSSGGMELDFPQLPTGTGESWKAATYTVVVTRNADDVVAYTGSVTVSQPGCAAPTPGVNPPPAATPTNAGTSSPGPGSSTATTAHPTRAATSTATAAPGATATDSANGSPEAGTPTGSAAPAISDGSATPRSATTDAGASVSDSIGASSPTAASETDHDSRWWAWAGGLVALGLAGAGALFVRHRRRS